MDRNRGERRTTMAATNGLSRRRHRTSSLRDSPEEDGSMEMQESVRLRDRASLKKERERDRDRERERERDRDRDRLSRSKRRRADKFMQREDGGDETSEESVNDEEEDEELILNHRKSYPPPAKAFRAPAPAWKVADEMIGVSVPRKARSASTKRTHECWTSGGGVSGLSGGELIHRQASPAPTSPSSSNVSLKKKVKPNGSKPRPPRSGSRSSSAAQEEIEIEIAEVLYGLSGQNQGPSKQDISSNDSMKIDPREASKLISEVKSRVSSPISNSPSVLPQNSNSSAATISAVAPKRKKPRVVKYEDENPSLFTGRSSPISSSTKPEIDQPAKVEASSPTLEKNTESAAENGAVSRDLAGSKASPPRSESLKPESNVLLLPELKPPREESESRGVVGGGRKEPQSPRKESPNLRLDDDRENATTTKGNLTGTEAETQKEDKFQIDLMAPPPSRPSPEREVEIDLAATDPQPVVVEERAAKEAKTMEKDEEKTMRTEKEAVAVKTEAEKAKETAPEEGESRNPVNKERNFDLQLDLEKSDRDGGSGGESVNAAKNLLPKHTQQPSTEKNPHSSALPLPMSVPGWPGGLPPMGYMAPLQGVVSMDGSTVPSAVLQPPQLHSLQPRPKRCATHCYIARNISYHQQVAKINPFWQAAAGSSSLYGTKACNLNMVPPADSQSKGHNFVQDKTQGLTIFPGNPGKDKGSQAASAGEAAQRKQMLLQQALPPGTPSNILPGPAFIFPLSQQQAAAAASVRPGSTVKSISTAGGAAASCTTNSITVTAAGTATAMSFNYPNIPGNETQYLAILQNGAYPFPIPAPVGAPPVYRGTHSQSMPFFNPPFYPSQMLHPSQLQQQQQQQQQQQPTPVQSQQNQQAHQSTGVSSISSSSQKHLQNQNQGPHGSGINNGSGTLQGFPSKSQSLQQQPGQHVSHQVRHIETKMGSEEDNRVTRSNLSVYGQNFPVTIHPGNFALMTPPSVGSEKKQQSHQQQGSKAGADPLPSQTFAMSFTSVNGASAPGLDISPIPPSHAFIQSIQEGTRQSYQIMAAAAASQAAQQKKNYRDEGKGGSDSSKIEEERRGIAGKPSVNGSQSIVFSRADLIESSVSSMPGTSAVDGSTRALNLGSTSAQPSGSVMPAAIGSVANASSSQRSQHQQYNHFQKQHQYAATVAATAGRSKVQVTGSGGVYSDQLSSSSSVATKFPNALSGFPSNLVPNSSGSVQSPQWKNSVRAATSQVSSPAVASVASGYLKNLPQQPSRVPQSHTQISFAANAKPTTPQGQPPSTSNQSPSPPVRVSSPTTSMSKGAGGSPRTSAASSGNKICQASTLSSQQAKNSPSLPSQKSSPVCGSNVPSILGSPQINSSNTGTKSQLPVQQQQQLPKQQMPQQHQLYFSTPYMQVQSQQSTSATVSYLPRRQSEQQQKTQQLQQGSTSSSSTGMLSLCPPVTLANASTSDPAKAAVAASNLKGGALSSQGHIHASQFAVAHSPGNPLVPPGFPYIPAPVHVKPAEHKQPAGE